MCRPPALVYTHTAHSHTPGAPPCSVLQRFDPGLCDSDSTGFFIARFLKTESSVRGDVEWR